MTAERKLFLLFIYLYFVTHALYMYSIAALVHVTKDLFASAFSGFAAVRNQITAFLKSWATSSP